MDEEKPITRRRVGRVIPLGYKVSEEDDRILIQIPEHMELIYKAKKFIENNCSYKETAEWLAHHTGRKLTGMGLREVLKRVINKGW
tara:strand:+ start:880 stop:1137 length:258 start_codon:yes stop_codon:yes gene_type:complete